jgi:hypothetical protein
LKKPFFIMMYSQDGEMFMPLTGNPEHDYEDDDPSRYATRQEAEQAARDHWVASQLGYEVFSMEEAE